MNLVTALLLFQLFSVTLSSRILGLFPHPGRSHYVVFDPLMKGLAAKGHDVTVVSYFPSKTPTPNLVDLKFDLELDLSESFNLNMYVPRSYFTHFIELYELSKWGKIACEAALNSSVIDEILRLHAENPFDLVVTEFFNTDCMLGVIYKMNIPFTSISSCALMPWLYDRLGTPDIASFIPSEFVGFTEQMTWWERFTSFTVNKVVKYAYRNVQWSDNALLERKFGPGLPDVRDIAKNTSLMLVNAHYTLHGPRPTATNLIEVGGIHVGPEKPLPSDLAKVLDEAKDGAIVFSWGSMLNTSTMSDEFRGTLFGAFARLKQTVVIKWESGRPKDTPKNVYTVRWLPQRDLLCHPNVKVFISHGGMLGTTEAAYCGVPVVGVPFYGDQPLNVAALEYRGMGVRLPFEDINEHTLVEAVQKMLAPEVRANAKFVSDEFKNRQIKPLDEAIWWTEYAIRTKGKLIRSHARNMDWFTYHSLDVIFPILFGFLFIFYFITNVCCGSKKTKLDKDKKYK